MSKKKLDAALRPRTLFEKFVVLSAQLAIVYGVARFFWWVAT